MTIAIVIVWIRVFPAQGGVDRMNELEPLLPDVFPLTIVDGAN
ncbi:MAG TPA: hypothetical protein VG228_10080 [Solirubrobacteraceae bacterium]|jgi:hypothetical protein|nr:hypothetical protein [Solirubrobacteraceae bacterium]